MENSRGRDFSKKMDREIFMKTLLGIFLVAFPFLTISLFIWREAGHDIIPIFVFFLLLFIGLIFGASFLIGLHFLVD